MTRIVELGKLYAPHVGGVERHMQWLVDELRSDPATQVDVLCGQARAARGTTESFGTRGSLRRLTTLARIWSTPIALGLPAAIDALRPDVLHLHAPYPWADVAGAAAFRAYPTVVTHHMDIVRQAWLLPAVGRWYRGTLAAARKVIATSPQIVRQSPWLSALDPRKVEVVPLGIDVAFWDALAARPIPCPVPAWIETLPRPIHLFVGRLVYYKGLPALLHALAGLPGTLVVAGKGPMRPELERLALQLGTNVQFVGDVDDSALSALYRRSDVFVLPSDSRAEAFGLVLLEAALHRLPLVTCRVGTGVEYVNLDGVTGVQVPPGDVRELRAALRALGADPARRAQLGAAGEQRVRREFDTAVLAPRHRQVLESVVVH